MRAAVRTPVKLWSSFTSAYWGEGEAVNLYGMSLDIPMVFRLRVAQRDLSEENATDGQSGRKTCILEV